MIIPVGITLIVIVIGYYCIYSLIIRILANRKMPHQPMASRFTPFLSIVIPTYNESKMIEKRIRNFDSLDYPSGQFEVIFVDGASTDGTPELVERLRADHRSFIRLVRQSARQGYNSAIYEGVCQARSDIIVTAEVGALFEEKALRSIVGQLTRPGVGVATGKSVLYNPDESFASRLEAAYRRTHDMLRYAESRVDSTPDMKGELLCFRKEIGLKLRPGEGLSDTVAFDMAVSYMARRMGWRAIFDPESIFHEYAPTVMRDRLIVQIRRGTTFAGAVLAFRSMIFNPDFGYFGLLIAPSRLLMLLIFPWVLLIASVILTIESLWNPWPAVVILAMACVALLLKKTRYTFLSFILSQVVLAIASLRLALHKETRMINTVPTARR